MAASQMMTVSTNVTLLRRETERKRGRGRRRSRRDHNSKSSPLPPPVPLLFRRGMQRNDDNKLLWHGGSGGGFGSRAGTEAPHKA